MTATLALPRPLWTRDFSYYFLARTVSLFGDAMLPVALALGVIRAGYGASGVGYSLAAWTAPIAVLVPFGGVLADRFGPRRMMVGADIARIGTQTLLALSFVSGAPALWQILVLCALSGAATAMFQPGVASIVPQVATDAQKANATLRVAEALTGLIGPATAGVLIAFTTTATVFAVDAATYVISALSLAALRLPRADRIPERSGVWVDLREGWREFTARTWLWAVIAIWVVMGVAVFGPAMPLGAELIAARHGDTGYGLVASAFGGGTILGGLIGMRWRPMRPLLAGAAAMILFSLYPLVIAMDLSLGLQSAGMIIAGAGFSFWSVMWATTVQTHVPAAVLNRVYAYDVAGSLVSIGVGRAIAGPLTTIADGRTILYVSTAACVLACLCLALSPAIRGLRSQEAFR